MIGGCARHLGMVVEVNEHMNLTRIANPREAAIKHVLDSVLPWRLFEGARRVLDAGTGPGFPGIPLALMLPECHVTMAESTGKKARFVEGVIAALALPNASVLSERVEDIGRRESYDVVTARAFAPLPRALKFLAPLLKKGCRALLYKGPDVESEIAEASRELKTLGVRCSIAMRYDLPDGLGTRNILEIAK